MPFLSEKNRIALLDLKKDYQEAETSDALMSALSAMDGVSPSLEDAWLVYQAYLNASVPVDARLNKAHHAFSESPFAVTLGMLGKEKLSIEPHAQDYFNAIVSHDDSLGVVASLINLQKAGFLDVLTDADRENLLLMIAKIEVPTYFSYILGLLSDAGLLTGEYAQANFSLVASHHNQSELFQALVDSQEQGFLQEKHAQEDLEFIASHPNPVSLVEALEGIQEYAKYNRVDVQLSRREIANQPQPMCFVSSFIMLHFLGLLDGEQGEVYRARINEPQCSIGFDGLINLLEESKLLEKEQGDLARQIQQVMDYSAILFSEDMHQVWTQIPEDVLTQEVWNHIRQICRANQINLEAGRVHLERYIMHDLLGIEREQTDTFNQAQSTHTASVHQTVSDSAKRLDMRYGALITNLKDDLEKIKNWVNAQKDHDVEQRAIQKLTHASRDFKEPTSGITTKKLLALSWAAIHDDEQRQGSLEDAQKLFLQGLYEIQRAYNLSENFEDRDGADKAACASGTFNKIMEKLVGIHPEVELKYITPQGAMLKLIPLIHQAAQAHLKKQDIEKLTVEALKNAIRPLVREQLFFEFGTEPELTALTHHYKAFEIFQASDDYTAFQGLLRQEQDTGLELMVSGKLDLADEELDAMLDKLITLAQEQSPRAETPKGGDELTEQVTKQPLSREAIRELRRALFEKPSSGDEPDDTSPSL